MQNVITSRQVGDNVRAAMAERRVDQTTIAELLGKAQSSISDRLNGKTEFRIAELQAIATFLDVPLEQLVTPAIEEAAS